MDRTREIFIPFIEKNQTEKCIEKILLDQNFGQIMDIEMCEKKIKKNGKLVYAKHKYAFIRIFIFNTIQGNNLLENIITNKTTHIISTNNKNVVNLAIKSYLSIKERNDKGFELHVKKIDRSFYDNIYEKKQCENDYKEIEKELNKYYLGIITTV